jgi:uncharacterized protein (UPF0210 family)
MHIRTVTYFLEPGFPLAEDRIADAGRVTSEVKDALAEAGYTVQSVRLATSPFPRVLNGDPSRLKQLALDLEAACFVHKIDYAAVGPARPGDGAAAYLAIPEAIGATERVFASASIAERDSEVNVPAARWAAEAIQRCSTLSANGFGNLRFTVLAMSGRKIERVRIEHIAKGG